MTDGSICCNTLIQQSPVTEHGYCEGGDEAMLEQMTCAAM